MILAGEEGFALEHFCKDAASAPDIDLDVVLLPGEHDLRRTVVPGGHISRHLGVLDTGQAEVANLQIAVLVDQNIAGLQVSVDDASGVDIFQTTLLNC